MSFNLGDWGYSSSRNLRDAPCSTIPKPRSASPMLPKVDCMLPRGEGMDRSAPVTGMRTWGGLVGSGGGRVGGVGGVFSGTSGVLVGTSGVFVGTSGVLVGTSGVFVGTSGVLVGVSVN